MIKILPVFPAPSFSRRLNKIQIAGCYFDISIDFGPQISLPPNLCYLGDDENGRSIVSKTSSSGDWFRYYDETSGSMTDSVDLESYVRSAIYGKIYTTERVGPRKNKKTTIKDIKTKEEREIHCDAGESIYETHEFIIFKKHEKILKYYFHKSEIAWERDVSGIFFGSHDGKLIFYNPIHAKKVTEVSCLDLDSGWQSAVDSFPYLLHISKIEDRKIILIGGKDGEQVVIVYEIDSGSRSVFCLGDKLSMPGIFDGKIVQWIHEDQFAVWSGGDIKDNLFRFYDLNGGVFLTEVALPGVMFSRYPNFFKINTLRGAVGQSRNPWPENYWKLILWNSSDFNGSSPDIFEEPLFGIAERIATEGQSHYSVLVNRQCENYFQLHRQLSVKLHQTGAINGYHMSRDDKERDPDFNGKLICDVSNHDLNEKEKLAIRHMCEHVAFELTDGGFRSSYDPAVKIHIEPTFKDA